MTGWLVVNGYLKSRKFNEIYDFLLKAAKRCGANVELYTSDMLFAGQADGFIKFGKPDFVLFWDKDVALAHLLESAGFRLFNSKSTIEICDSKVLSYFALREKVPLPQTLIAPKTFANIGYTNFQFIDDAAQILGFPLIIKEAYGSFGEQIYLVNSIGEATALVQKLAGRDFIFQQFIAESRGRDIRLNVVGGKVVNAILRHSRTDFRSNVTLGGIAEPYIPTAEEIAVAELASNAVNADFAGIDVLFGKDGPLICEVNSNLHFKTTFDATGVDLSEYILKHIIKCVQ